MGQTREQRIIKQVVGKPTVERVVPIATGMIMPNHSGIASHPEFTKYLSDYVPYTGATKDVDLGSKNFTTTGTGTFLTQVNTEYIGNSGTSSIISVDTGTIFDNAAGNTSIDWENRYLYASDGSTIMLDWSTDGTADFKDNNITTTGNVTGTELTATTTTEGKGAVIGAGFFGNWILNSAYGDKEFACMCHDDLKNTATAYAFMQRHSGETYFNAPSGKDLNFMIGGTPQGKIDSGGNLDMFDGNITTTGGVTAGASTFGDGGTTNYTEIKADGEINLHGTARVEKCIVLRVGSFKAPGSNPADLEDLGIAQCYAFDPNVQQYISSEIIVPNDMDISVAPTLKADWSAAATTGTAVWQLEYLWRAPDEDMTAAAQETIRGESDPSGTSNGLVVAEMTGIDAPSSTDRVLLIRISRDTTDGTYTDDMAGDAHLTAVKLCYTSNKLGEAI